MKFFAIALGGAFGALLRVYGSEWIDHKLGWGYPHGTMVVNLLGAVCIGLCLGFLQMRPELPQWIRFLLVSGALGGFTTFSTFIYELLSFVTQGQYGEAFYYGGLQLIGGFLLCWIGLALGRSF